MDNLTWYKGKRLKTALEGMGHQLDLPRLAVVMILAAREQGLSLEEIVQELILANDFDAAVNKLDKSKTIRELGF